MATPNRQSKPYTYRTEQEIANNSYDEQYKVETVAPLGYRSDIDSFVPININADGTPAQAGFIPYAYDRITFSNPDANGNYQTGTIKKSGTTLGTLTITYDGSSNITDIYRT